MQMAGGKNVCMVAAICTLCLISSVFCELTQLWYFSSMPTLMLRQHHPLSHACMCSGATGALKLYMYMYQKTLALLSDFWKKISPDGCHQAFFLRQSECLGIDTHPRVGHHGNYITGKLAMKYGVSGHVYAPYMFHPSHSVEGVNSKQ